MRVGNIYPPLITFVSLSIFVFETIQCSPSLSLTLCFFVLIDGMELMNLPNHSFQTNCCGVDYFSWFPCNVMYLLWEEFKAIGTLLFRAS